MSLPVLIFSIASFCVYLYKHRTPKRRPRRQPRIVKNDYAPIRPILKSLEDQSCEKVDVSVVDPVKADFTLRFPIGAEVSFEIDDGMLQLVVGGRRICSVLFGLGSNVQSIVESRKSYRAFITDRDEHASGFYDFFTVSVFYKL